MRSCDICARGTQVMQKKSHSQIKHKTHQKINVQTKKMEGGAVLLCSKCLRTVTKLEKEFLAKQTPKKVVVNVDSKKSYGSTAKTTEKVAPVKKVAAKKTTKK